MAKKSSGLGKLFKDIKKNQKKVDKMFGSKPAPKKAAAPKEPKEVTKTGKLVAQDKEALAAADFVEIEQDGDRWAAMCDESFLGYLPASLSKYMEDHEEYLQNADVEVDGTVTLTFIIG